DRPRRAGATRLTERDRRGRKAFPAERATRRELVRNRQFVRTRSATTNTLHGTGGSMGTLSVDGVTVAYGDGPPVLRDVSVTVEPGQMIAITGPSGAGKSTLLATMAGLLRPREGT